MIDKQTVDKILDAAQIVDVVSDFVTLRKRGVNYIGLCPFHDEKTGSFTVSPSKSLYKCFGCGKAGHSVGFIMEIEQCSYVDALRQLARKYHIEIEERELTAEEKQNGNGQIIRDNGQNGGINGEKTKNYIGEQINSKRLQDRNGNADAASRYADEGSARPEEHADPVLDSAA